MGIYDRDYYREQQPGFTLKAPRTAVTTIILINVALWVVDSLIGGGLSKLTALEVGALGRPWLWWQFLTYGFTHSLSMGHVLGNMVGLFFLGREVEHRYGTREFVRLYLVMIVFAGVVWAVVNTLQGGTGPPVIGASGAVVGVILLFALNFPRRTVLLFFVFPMPAWILGVFIVLVDLFGIGDERIAVEAHLAGAAFAFLYFQQQWSLGRFFERWFSWLKISRRPKLRIHRPDEEEPDDKLSAQVDEILEKIHREGESSLSRKERRILQNASKKYQNRRD